MWMVKKKKGNSNRFLAKFDDFAHGNTHQLHGNTHKLYGNAHEIYGNAHQLHGNTHQLHGNTHLPMSIPCI